MGTNVAVILAVPKYDSLLPLPSCASDAKVVHTLLHKSGKFSDVLLLDKPETRAVIMGSLSDFFRKYESEPVDDFLFYYTGHGAVIDEEFRYLLSDFDKNKPNGTSISNSNLDDLARSIEPSLYCKVVDACQSGVSYIKDDDAFRSILEKGKAKFKSCYFFFSSQYDQSSFADNELSHFTRGLIKALVSYPEASIGYNDLACTLADLFHQNVGQTPYFVQQAKLTEVFLEISPDMRTALRSTVLEKDETSASINRREGLALTLKDRVQADATR